MLVFYALIAILSAWRLTELFTIDRLTDGLRRRFPIYLWTCPRCMSVWAGIAATVAFFYCPLLNLPLAMSWLFVLQLQLMTKLFKTKDRQIILDVDQNYSIDIQSKFKQPEMVAILQRTLAGLLQQQEQKPSA